MTPTRKRQPKDSGNYREIRTRVTFENWGYINELDADASLAKNLKRIIEEHRKFVRISKSQLTEGGCR